MQKDGIPHINVGQQCGWEMVASGPAGRVDAQQGMYGSAQPEQNRKRSHAPCRTHTSQEPPTSRRWMSNPRPCTSASRFEIVSLVVLVTNRHSTPACRNRASAAWLPGTASLPTCSVPARQGVRRAWWPSGHSLARLRHLCCLYAVMQCPHASLQRTIEVHQGGLDAAGRPTAAAAVTARAAHGSSYRGCRRLGALPGSGCSCCGLAQRPGRHESKGSALQAELQGQACRLTSPTSDHTTI